MISRLLDRLKKTSRRARTVFSTALGVVTVAAAGIWDAQRQDEFALNELIHAHHLLATALATRIAREPVRGLQEGRAFGEQVLAAGRVLGAEGNVVVMLQTPERREFSLSDGRVIELPDLERVLARNEQGVTLSRDVAGDLGLRQRAAVAGVARFRWPSGGEAAVAVVGSAGAERDRRRHDQWRTVLTTLLVGGLVLGSGAAALRRQRRELDLERRLAVHRTERERDAELARADRMAAIAAISSGIAHDIATPLGIISGRLEQLTQLLGTADATTKLIDSIAQQVDRINKVIRGLLGLARGDSPTLMRVAPAKLASEAAQLVKHRFAVANVELRVNVLVADDRLVACDTALFEQVLVNLLVNALEASSSGQLVELRVEEGERQVYFSVIDQGSGISETAISRATEPFFTTKARQGGSGLGLAIARQIVAHHRGQLSVARRRSGEGEGTGTLALVALPESS
ncbi:MAG TPA: HAMP domain-containing sensor histidine kinase [Polyangiaceae bacterium]|nr:HAMP domain-containing sensor histidine kinase [Polyangiaceae bacterium]